jgi:glucokinase
MSDISLAIDIGGSKLLVGVVDKEGNIISQAKTMFIHPTQNSIMKDIRELCTSMIAGKDVGSIGVSIPGLADPNRGLWLDSVFSKVHDFPIGPILSDTFHLPVFIDNDANNCACAERMFGCAKHVDDFIWLTISNGCGSGVFLGGKLFSGCFGNAGEIGHICVTDEPYVCPCGNVGCLEAVAAGPGIVRRYLKATGISKTSLSAKDIADLAKKGDQVALSVFQKTGIYIGRAIAAAVNVLNVPLVVLGGGISLDSNLFMNQVKESVAQHIYRTANRNLEITTTKLGYDASLLGAAANAFIYMK